jgi:hypothetical protein
MVPRFFPRAMDEPSGDGRAVLGYGLRGTTDGTDIQQYEETEREIDDAHGPSLPAASRAKKTRRPQCGAG